MSGVSVIGIDLAKRASQRHGAGADGSALSRKKLPRGRLLPFLAEHPPVIIAMEACASAHHWGRGIRAPGHEVRLLPPICVKPFVKRQKNDAAEAIVEAASRPTMRCVTVKTAGQQGNAMIFRARDLWVRQRAQTINALRGHLAELGIGAPSGHARVDRSIAAVGDETTAIPDMARNLARMMLAQIEEQTARIEALGKGIRLRAPKGTGVARLMTIPGVGPISAMAVKAFCPPMGPFRNGRGFAAWVGLTPKQSPTGGKTRLGGISKMGQRDIRRLSIVGASAVVRWAARKGAPAGSWLARMMARKPHMLVVVALANKMARAIRALMAGNEVHREPALAA